MQYDMLLGTIFLNISGKHVFNIIPLFSLSLVCLGANIVQLGTYLVRTKLKAERMECNIGQDAIFLIHSEILYYGQATGKLYHFRLRVLFFFIYKAGCEPTPYC
jgi:hypothetical protein